jgi:hypothetical protein
MYLSMKIAGQKGINTYFIFCMSIQPIALRETRKFIRLYSQQFYGQKLVELAKISDQLLPITIKL